MLWFARSLKARTEATCAAIMHQARNFSDFAEAFSEVSDRQQHVITLVCNGLSNKEIARKLDVTEGTIKAHLHAIYEKLGVRSRIELMIALRPQQSKVR